MDPNIVKTRMGHYHVPGRDEGPGYEHAALVVDADPEAGEVGVTVWEKSGDMYARLHVPITGSPEAEGKASFHLVSACPLTQVIVTGG